MTGSNVGSDLPMSAPELRVVNDYDYDYGYGYGHDTTIEEWCKLWKKMSQHLPGLDSKQCKHPRLSTVKRQPRTFWSIEHQDAHSTVE